MNPWAQMIAFHLVALADAGHPNVTVDELEDHTGLPVGIVTVEIAVNLTAIREYGAVRGVLIDPDFRVDAANGGPVVGLRFLVDVARRIAA